MESGRVARSVVLGVMWSMMTVYLVVLSLTGFSEAGRGEERWSVWRAARLVLEVGVVYVQESFEGVLLPLPFFRVLAYEVTLD